MIFETKYNQLHARVLVGLPNGDVSFVAAPNKEDAIQSVRRVGQRRIGEAFPDRKLYGLLDFRLADTGELVFEGFWRRV